MDPCDNPANTSYSFSDLPDLLREKVEAFDDFQLVFAPSKSRSELASPSAKSGDEVATKSQPFEAVLPDPNGTTPTGRQPSALSALEKIEEENSQLEQSLFEKQLGSNFESFGAAVPLQTERTSELAQNSRILSCGSLTELGPKHRPSPSITDKVPGSGFEEIAKLLTQEPGPGSVESLPALAPAEVNFETLEETRVKPSILRTGITKEPEPLGISPRGQLPLDKMLIQTNKLSFKKSCTNINQSMDDIRVEGSFVDNEIKIPSSVNLYKPSFIYVDDSNPFDQSPSFSKGEPQSFERAVSDDLKKSTSISPEQEVVSTEQRAEKGCETPGRGRSKESSGKKRVNVPGFSRISSPSELLATFSPNIAAALTSMNFKKKAAAEEDPVPAEMRRSLLSSGGSAKKLSFGTRASPKILEAKTSQRSFDIYAKQTRNSAVMPRDFSIYQKPQVLEGSTRPRELKLRTIGPSVTKSQTERKNSMSGSSKSIGFDSKLEEEKSPSERIHPLQFRLDKKLATLEKLSTAMVNRVTSDSLLPFSSYGEIPKKSPLASPIKPKDSPGHHPKDIYGLISRIIEEKGTKHYTSQPKKSVKELPKPPKMFDGPIKIRPEPPKEKSSQQVRPRSRNSASKPQSRTITSGLFSTTSLAQVKQIAQSFALMCSESRRDDFMDNLTSVQLKEKTYSPVLNKNRMSNTAFRTEKLLMSLEAKDGLHSSKPANKQNVEPKKYPGTAKKPSKPIAGTPDTELIRMMSGNDRIFEKALKMK